MAMASKRLLFWCLLLLFCWLAHGFQRLSLEQHLARFRAMTAVRLLSDNGTGRVFSPVDYGADPTGVKDSSEAIQRAVEAAFKVQKGEVLLPGVNDLGGVVIDLGGGDYKISKPVMFPSTGGGNVVFQRGTLRASPDFPGNAYLIQFSATTTDSMTSNSTTSSSSSPPPFLFEDITFRDLLLDSSFRGGGLLIASAVRTRLDNLFVIHFSTAGVRVRGGHETFLTSSFLGQHVTAGGDPGERLFSGVAVDLASNDNAITDVAIFSAATGVLLRGQANILSGVHCYNKATYWGGVGIYVKLPGFGLTRIDNCYMDYTGIVIEDPVQVQVTNGLFLGNANIALKSVKGRISGLTIVNNMFSGQGWKVPIVQVGSNKFRSVEQVVIENNSVKEMHTKATAARVAVGGKGKRWVADFSEVLLFPDRIRHVECGVYVKGKGQAIPRHAVTEVADNRVVVEADSVVDAVVSVAVDQNSRPGEADVFA